LTRPTPAIHSNPVKSNAILAREVVGHGVLRLTFADGLTGEVDVGEVDALNRMRDSCL
jgi:hypothetical protein